MDPTMSDTWAVNLKQSRSRLKGYPEACFIVLSQPCEYLLVGGASPGFVDQDVELVVSWGREDEAGVNGPPLKLQGIHTFYAKRKDISAIGNAGHFKARVG